MKLKIINMLLVFLLTISITACDDNKSRSTGHRDEESLAMEAYKTILQSEVEFFSTDDKKYVYLNDFLKEASGAEVNLKVTNFAVLDMDGDEIPEVVLELSLGDYPDYFEILHYKNDTVYGYNFVYRGLMQLKTDGTFRYSNSGTDIGYGKLKFESNNSETEILGYSEASYNNDDMSISYFINNELVTEESFNSFCKEQNEKEDVTWHEFSKDNIENKLYINA